MSETRRCAVIGAGPAGAATAAYLARSGWTVDVYERRPRIEQKICGEMLSPPGRAILQEIDALQRIPGALKRGHSIRLVGRRGSSLDLDFGNSEEGLPCTIPRPVLDQAIVDAAREAGARFHFGKRVGRLESLEPADAIVGADGRHSWVAREIGLAPKRPHPIRHCALMAFFRPEERSNLSFVEMHATEWGYAGLNPTPDGLVNVIAVLEPERLRKLLRGRGEAGLVDLLAELTQGSLATAGLKRALGGAQVTAARGRRAWTVGAMAWVPRSAARGKHALVGDSAGFVDPYTGEGLYHALASAKALAERLRDSATVEEGLARYDTWHARAFMPENLFCERLQRVIKRERLFEYGLRQLARKPALARELAEAVADRAPVERVLSLGYWARVLSPIGGGV